MRGLWSHLERLGAGRIDGGIGTRGPGETQIETDRRLARDRIAALKRKLAHVGSSRSVMRAERERAGLPRVALAGYTNAGKSTLLNALTGAGAGVGERLFHTLDPTTRILRTTGRNPAGSRATGHNSARPRPGGGNYLVTDTVGFIRKLPHQLVDAFAATLEETRLADLILHVVDASVPEEEMLAMIRAVDEVLATIGADEVPQLLVLSKADHVGPDRRAELALWHPRAAVVSARRGAGIGSAQAGAGLVSARTGAVLVSAHTGEGIEGLIERVEAEFARRLERVELLIPYDEGGRLAELHEVSGDLEREETSEGVRVRARLPATVAARYGRFATPGRV
jgi:GTP-binding protein HflX